MKYLVTLKDADGVTCKIEIENAKSQKEAGFLAEKERGAGWMAIRVEVVK